MKLQLKESPKEWQKFALALAVFVNVLGGLWWRKGRVSSFGLGCLALGAAGLLIVALLRPRAVRGLHHAAMRFSFGIGQVVGPILLTLFFLLILTPLALILRASGRQFLELRIDRHASTYWHAKRANRNFERQF